jgi:hypothetical protein
MDAAARDSLAGLLAESRAAIAVDDTRTGPERELVGELLDRIGDAGAVAPAEWLEAVAGSGRQAELADLVSVLARHLAPDDEPPSSGGDAQVWRALVAVAERLGGAAVEPLGRLPFVGDRLLDLLVRESRDQLPERPEAGRRIVGPAGRALSSLAVSGKLRRAVAGALGFEVAPSYSALYEYDPPGSHVRTHLDRRDYELVVHVILEHDLPGDGSPGSALVVHRPGGAAPSRLHLRPGESVALSGRGTIHSWEPLRGDERRTLVGIGFTRA